MPRQSNPNLQPISKKRQPSGSELAAKRKQAELRAKKDAELASKFFKKLSGDRKPTNGQNLSREVANFPPSSQNLTSTLPKCYPSTNASTLTCATTNEPAKNHDDDGNDQPNPNESQVDAVFKTSGSEKNDAAESCDTPEGQEKTSFVKAVDDSDPFDVSDPSTWSFPTLPSQVLQLQENDPVQIVLKTYPKTGKRAFNPKNFVDNNGKNRTWLLYSKRSNSLFCFCCCVYPNNKAVNRSSPWTNFGIGNKGFSDYNHQKRGIELHEQTDAHFQSEINWKEYKKRVQERKCIDQVAMDQLSQEVSFWKKVLRGLLDAIIFLAKNNLAFLGSHMQIGEQGCGNYLSLVELLSKYYHPLSVHVSRITSSQCRTSYMSPAIQNEFIDITSKTVRNTILMSVKDRKYYSIMFDATPDISHKEQISFVVRSVHVSVTGCYIEENFLGFLHFDLKTGEDICKKILDQLQEDGLDIQNCRGQGYDNGSNMSGAYKGVQARIKSINPNAIFVPCAAHSLNLVGQNSATKVLPAKLLLGQIQSLYNFFSGSPLRWNTMKNLVKKTLKCQSSTRWSSKADAVSALVDNFDHVCEALLELANSETSNGQTVVEANSLHTMISNYKFLFGSVIWKIILNRINLCNKLLQNMECTLDEATKHLEGLLFWLRDFQETGFEIAAKEARDKAERCGIGLESGFDTRIARGRKPARFRDGDETRLGQQSNLERFKHEFFDKIMSTLLEDLTSRFQCIGSTKRSFEFMWGLKLDQSSIEELVEAASELAGVYQSDLEKNAFIKEIGYLKFAVTPFLGLNSLDCTSPLDILNLLSKHKLDKQFPNIVIALQIFLTLPVTVASNERSFSKLKIIKNHLRSTMGQQRLSNLSILSIEHKIVKEINFDQVIKRFAVKKCRRVSI